jgi:hypothetical protein
VKDGEPKKSSAVVETEAREFLSERTGEIHEFFEA